MHHQILCIFIFLALLPMFSSATESTPERSINCYKYEKTFPDVNIFDPPVEEKEVVKCDQCFGYICYSKTAEYVLGYGCREDFFKTCNFSSYIQNRINEQSNKALCSPINKFNAIGDSCLTDYCSPKKLPICIDLSKKKGAKKPLGNYTYADITFTQLTTPAPTTTTESSSNSENGNNDDSGNGNQGNPDTNGTANSKMISFVFFGIFIFTYFM